MTPQPCTSCGSPDARLRPHGHAGERLCVACWDWLTRALAGYARFGWRVAVYGGRTA